LFPVLFWVAVVVGACAVRPGSLLLVADLLVQPQDSQPVSANPVNNIVAQAIPGILPIGFPLPREWTRRPPRLPGSGVPALLGRGSIEPSQQSGGTLASVSVKVKLNGEHFG
jgi:hypothetical protein